VPAEDVDLRAAVEGVHNDSAEKDAHLYRLDVAEALHSSV
jgi:hypothetical protein